MADINGTEVAPFDTLTIANGEKPEAPLYWKGFKGSGRIEYLFDRHGRQVFRDASTVIRDTDDPSREAGQ